MQIIKSRKGELFDCIEREGDLKDTQRYTQNAALNVDLFYNIFSVKYEKKIKELQGERIILPRYLNDLLF